jgi:hypothetical protein
MRAAFLPLPRNRAFVPKALENLGIIQHDDIGALRRSGKSENKWCEIEPVFRHNSMISMVSAG